MIVILSPAAAGCSVVLGEAFAGDPKNRWISSAPTGLASTAVCER